MFLNKKAYSFFVVIFIGLAAVASTKALSGYSSQTATPALKDSLTAFIKKANSLWAQKESNLQLSTDLLSLVSDMRALTYYDFANTFYYWSLKNGSFEKEQEAISNVFKRVKPLVNDSTAKKWGQYLDNKNPQLLDEIYGFWKIQDTYPSTKINERLLEHWQRINYAKTNFNRAKNPPYQTDDRGIYYLKLGQPDRIIKKTVYLNQVVDPNGEVLTFELGNLIQSEIEIWEYYKNDGRDSFFFLFGKHNGWGEFGIRHNLTELFDIDRIRVQFKNSGFIDSITMRRFSKKVAVLGILDEMAPIHPFFDNLYSRLRSNLSNSSFIGSVMNKYLRSSFFVEPIVYHKLQKNIAEAPVSETSTLRDEEKLSVNTNIYQFLSSDNKNQFLISLQAGAGENKTLKDSTTFLNNQLTIFDNDWNQIATSGRPKRATVEVLSKPSMFLIEEPLNKYSAFLSSEIIDTTRNNIFIPGKINPKASAIIASSGRKKLDLPAALNKKDTLLISDILIGPDQKVNNGARVPIYPSMEQTYKPDSNLMVYFEAYNIPQGGYSFEYYFEKHRWLFGNKRVEEKPSVTIINDKAKSRNKQLFSISLSDLEEGTYDLIFEFRSLNENQQEKQSKTERIELVVEV